MQPLRVEVVRSGAIESEHLVDVAVVDHAGILVAAAGDPSREAAFRSSAKPIQAAVSIACGWDPRDEAALAIACASHNGEAGHVEAVRAILDGAGVPIEALRCPEAYPFRPADIAGMEGPARVAHNCSGKHAGMLAACAAAGWPLDDYRAPDHPLQQRVRALMRELLGVEPRELIDGCGVPTFVAPLTALARAFTSVAGSREAAAMRAHPWLVGGTDRFDTDLMAATEVVTKAGAEGLSCAIAGDLSIAIKVRDGAARARPPALLLVLSALGLVAEDLLPQHREPVVLGGGEPVGVLRARGGLARGEDGG